MKRFLLIFIKLGLLALLVVYLFNNIEWRTLFDAMLDYSTAAVLAIVAFLICVDGIVALRWRFLCGYTFGFVAAFESFMISAFLNNVLPAKLGEAAKVIYLRKIAAIPVYTTLPALFFERFFDVLFLATITVFAAGFLFDDESMKIYALIFITIMWSAIFLLKFYKNIFLAILNFIPFKMPRIVLKKSLHMVHKKITLNMISKTSAWTLVIWIGYFLFTALFLGFVANFELSIGQFIVVFVVASIAMAIPLAPAGVGTYHAGLVLTLGWYGVPKEDALAAAIVLHVCQIVPPTVIGVVILIKNGMGIKSLMSTKV